ncbi:hypothetical protein FKM82_014418 [Ascaphus truei]
MLLFFVSSDWSPVAASSPPGPTPPLSPSHQGKTVVKKPRTAFSQAQLLGLQQSFYKQCYLTPMEIQELSERLKITYKQVKTWFQNRRMKVKRSHKNVWLDRRLYIKQENSPMGPCSEMPQFYPPGYNVASPAPGALGYQAAGFDPQVPPSTTLKPIDLSGQQPPPPQTLPDLYSGYHPPAAEVNYTPLSYPGAHGITYQQSFPYNPYTHYLPPHQPSVLQTPPEDLDDDDDYDDDEND